MRDVCAPDGLVYWGERIVREGGRVKFANEWWHHEQLKDLVGQTVEVKAEEYWYSEISIHWPAWKLPLVIKRKEQTEMRKT